MPKPYPIEFRQDVVRVARNREPGVTLEQIAADFGAGQPLLHLHRRHYIIVNANEKRLRFTNEKRWDVSKGRNNNQ